MNKTSVTTPDARLDDLRTAITKLAAQGSTADQIRQLALQFGQYVCEPPLTTEQVDAVLQDQLLRLTPVQHVNEPPAWAFEFAPPSAHAERMGQDIDREAAFETKKDTVPSGRVDFGALAQTKAPEFRWFVPGWLSPHPTLLAGRGGIGKSLTSLQLAVALACGRRFLGAATAPLRVCLWSCEEDLPELHRRLERICEHYQIALADLGENLLIDCRHGLDNTLLANAYGVPTWTSLLGYLREQVNDHQCDVWIGDNIAHLYACSENERHPVTLFTSVLSGLREGFAPLLIGHVAKHNGSEYSGSTAWENAVRMRWYLSDKLPDQASEDDDDEPGRVRYLSKRKSNYSANDLVKFTMQDDGLLVPSEAIELQSGVEWQARDKKARQTILDGLSLLNERGINSSARNKANNHILTLLKNYQLRAGCTPSELTTALNKLVLDGVIQDGEMGTKDSAGRKRSTLVQVKPEEE